MRPRFGPGSRTAIFAAMVVWLCGFLFHMDMLILGLVTQQTYALASLVALVQLIASAWVGGMLYKEDEAA